jgi:D-alanine--poly(phosphoribitol) ligase subunit 2
MIAADANVQDRALRALREVTGSAEVLTEPDLLLYRAGLLDSFATVTLILAMADEFGLEISPADFERERWATPRLLVADIARRLAERR